LKQLKENPWPEIVKKYPLGTIVEGRVVKVTNFGVFVRLEEELEGLVFADEVDPELVQSLKADDAMKVKVIKIDPDSAKIGLSAKIADDQTLEDSET